MAKKVKKKKPKKRAKHYEPKLAIDGSFIDVIKIAVGKSVEDKK